MSLIAKIKKLRHEIYIELYRHMPIQNNKIILWADSFKHFGCSPKYIALYLLKHYPGKFDLVWVFEDGAAIPEDMPKEIRVVKYFSIEYLKELHTAKFVICNMRTGAAHYWEKRRGQIYIQTWHSSLRLKKIEGDAAEHFTSDYIEMCKDDSRKIDLLLSGCRFSTDIFKRAFWYDGQILESGTPRCDILIKQSPEIRSKVFQYYHIPASQKFALYAPTFREDKRADIYGMDFNKLRQVLSDHWTLGCRLHPNILQEIETIDCISMSKYPDMQELIAAADLLITDYSSCMFDMAIAKKPCVLYAPDLEEYLAKERGLYFDIKGLPFPVARSMDELCQILSEFDYKAYQQKLSAFMDTIGSFEDGSATEKVVHYIMEKGNLKL